MTHLLFLCAAYVATVLETSTGDGAVWPEWLHVLAAAMVYWCSGSRLIGRVVVLGLLADLVATGPMGVEALVLVTLAFAARSIIPNLSERPLPLVVAVVCSCALLIAPCVSVLRALLQTGVEAPAWESVALQGVVTAAAAACLVAGGRVLAWLLAISRRRRERGAVGTPVGLTAG